MEIKCAECRFFRVLNPNHIVNGQPVKLCANSEQPGRFCGFEKPKQIQK